MKISGWRSVRQLAVSVLTVVALCLIAACAGGAGHSGGRAGAAGTLRVLLGTGTMDKFPISPLADQAEGTSQVMGLIWGNLVTLSAGNQLAPGDLVTGMPAVSSDGKTLTFHLRRNIRWTDGQPLTSQDVLWTFNVLANVHAGSAQSGYFSLVQGYDAVTNGTATTLSGFSAPDPYTFVIRLTQSSHGFLTYLPTAWVLPAHLLKKVPLSKLASDAFFNDPTVGVGPYQFVKKVPDQYYELTAAAHSSVGTPRIKTLFLEALSSDAATAQLAAGELDLSPVTSDDVAGLKASRNIGIVAAPAPNTYGLEFNLDLPYLKDPRIRQAVEYALDRPALVSKVLHGYGLPWTSDFLQKPLEEVGPRYDYDVAKARALLAAAHWNPATVIPLVHVAGNSDLDTLVTVVQSELAAVGIKIADEDVSAPAQVADLTDRKFGAVLIVGGTFVTDPYENYQYLGCNEFFPKFGGNISHLCDPQLDRLMNQADATANPAQRLATYKRAAAIENLNPWLVPVLVPDDLWAVSKKLKGFVAAGGNGAFAYDNIASWTLSS